MMSSNNTSETVYMAPGETAPGGNIYTDGTVWEHYYDEDGTEFDG